MDKELLSVPILIMQTRRVHKNAELKMIPHRISTSSSLIFLSVFNENYASINWVCACVKTSVEDDSLLREGCGCVNLMIFYLI